MQTKAEMSRIIEKQASAMKAIIDVLNNEIQLRHNMAHHLAELTTRVELMESTLPHQPPQQ